jgi:hypothetical protein
MLLFYKKLVWDPSRSHKLFGGKYDAKEKEHRLFDRF